MAASIKELKEKLAYSCNILAHEGHWDNILGHVSFRIASASKRSARSISSSSISKMARRWTANTSVTPKFSSTRRS